jgi:hypothetical protein
MIRVPQQPNSTDCGPLTLAMLTDFIINAHDCTAGKLPTLGNQDFIEFESFGVNNEEKNYSSRLLRWQLYTKMRNFYVN